MIEANKARVIAIAAESKKQIPPETLAIINGQIRSFSGHGKTQYVYHSGHLSSGQIKCLIEYLTGYGYFCEWVNDTIIIKWGGQ